MNSYSIETSSLLDFSGKLMDGHIKYGLGSKARLTADPKDIKAIDCSGFVRYLIYNASAEKITMPDGSWIQRQWCEKQKLDVVEYSTSALIDGWLRIAFISPKPGVAGHVWLILDGQTLESHGGVGPHRRAWDTKVLANSVAKCFKFAQTFTQYHNFDFSNLC